MGLRVLITNFTLWPRSGTVLYVRDVALELQRRGHTPVVFSSTNGEVALELREAGITVTDRLRKVAAPDVIHSHHHAPTLVALRRWPRVPAIHICHDHLSPQDSTPVYAQIRRHFGVSRLCVNRLVADGVSADAATLFPNFVDTARFQPRAPLPDRPRRALVFSNYASQQTHLPAVREACVEAGLQLDAVGAGVGLPAAEPERLLGRYDIVFAKAKAAMEAMAVGNSVILCDSAGVGPMVQSARFEHLRALNFGFEALGEPVAVPPILRQIARYDRADAARVRDMTRTRASLTVAVDRLLAIYGEVVGEGSGNMAADPGTPSMLRAFRARFYLQSYWAWVAMPQRDRDTLSRVPGIRSLKYLIPRIG